MLVEELERKNNELEAFSYSVSHDLRAPLRGIDGFSQALLEDYAEKLDSKGQDYLRRVRAGAQRMGELIDDLLELSRVGRAELTCARVDLSRTADSVLVDLKKRDPERKVLTVIEDGLQVEADGRLMRVALDNLLGNAWKFTAKRQEAKIEFRATRRDGVTTYFIRDNGAGFSMSYADKLFEAFQRLHSESEFPGSGIGLATVHRIIDRHGGRVWAEGEVDRGAIFYFTLPPARPGGRR